MEEKYTELRGLVVREVKTGENDKILTLLTAEKGLVTVSGKGLSSIRNKYAASSQLFSYSTFQLRKRGEFYYIADAFLIECFMNIRYDIVRLALANYVCDVAYSLALEDVGDEELLSLTLNTLYAAANSDERQLELIKGAFEFRAAVIEGFMPDLSACGICGREIAGSCVLDVMNGRLICSECGKNLEFNREYMENDTEAKIHVKLTPPSLAALRYIERASNKRFLSFTLDDDELMYFTSACEKYLLNHLERGFSSLDYYKKIK